MKGMVAVTELDCRGLSCPEPVLKTRSLLESQRSGEVRVKVSTSAARDNVGRLASRLGWTCQSAAREGEFDVILRR